MKNGGAGAHPGIFQDEYSRVPNDIAVDQKIERFQFADGTTWNSARSQRRIEAGNTNAMIGTAVTTRLSSTDRYRAEAPNAGIDTIQSSVSYSLPNNVERLVPNGQGRRECVGKRLERRELSGGNDGDNTFNGPGGAQNSLSGGTGAFAVMSGGNGNDTYYYDYLFGGEVHENPNEGIDTIFLTHGVGSFALPDNVEIALDVGGSRNLFARHRVQ
jgi:hypothetical protein